MDRPTRDSELFALRRLRLARILLLVQGVALVLVIGLALPSYLTQLLHPPSCERNQMCIGLGGFYFEASLVFLGPPALVIFATA